jgi:hypothetical protein
LAIDPTTGKIAGTLTHGSAGSHLVTLTVTDPGALTDTVELSWQVTHTNRAPTLTSPDDQAAVEGDIVDLSVTASDPDGDALAYDATGLPGGLAINSTTGKITGTVGYAAAGSHQVTITVNDPGGLSDTTSFSWQITDTNRPPNVTSPGDQFGVEGDVVQLPVTASDPDGDALTYDTSGLPSGLAIDATTGDIAGTLANGSAGTHAVTITVGDGGATSRDQFTWTVTPADLVPTPPSGLITKVTSTTAIDLDWADNPEPDVHHYTVYRASGPAGTFAVLATVAASASAYHDTTAPEGRVDYRVTATDVAGHESGPATVTLSSRIVLHGTTTAAR